MMEVPLEFIKEISRRGGNLLDSFEESGNFLLHISGKENFFQTYDKMGVIVLKENEILPFVLAYFSLRKVKASVSLGENGMLKFSFETHSDLKRFLGKGGTGLILLKKALQKIFSFNKNPFFSVKKS